MATLPKFKTAKIRQRSLLQVDSSPFLGGQARSFRHINKEHQNTAAAHASGAVAVFFQHRRCQTIVGLQIILGGMAGKATRAVVSGMRDHAGIIPAQHVGIGRAMDPVAGHTSDNGITSGL